ncbi:PREDICTED: uncharacterized protein LOC105962582 [Erythranthe guttata]|uniref:uncharacterized protein LOC105962582 n=1 Tax=Erythranthe guttata TaxID=4155 RepID=UPI00064DA017|nr:PREDICTED: uncharacterized protein LOC105962582 [Erythranthe guttata]|eukprot:XP_012842348.1 PREDICTED: uncharacterized protein LOC105962582 [Erythranthe guttata]
MLSKAKLIIWDEAPMMHMYCFEALDKTMKSILDSDIPFGGKVVVLGGDFRQILPVVLKASRQDIEHETSVLLLFTNADEIREFVDWILRIGHGDAGEVNDGDTIIEIPNDLLIHDSADPFLDLIEFVYPDLVRNLFTPDYFEGRAILSPTNESVGFVNDHFFSTITGEEKVYFSSDSMILSGKHVGDVVFIPRMTLVSSNSALPIKFQRRQFPLMVSFVMTINKSKRQTLSHVGMYLPISVFSHRQLYVALSRVKSRSGIKILMNSESGDATNVTNYVVYKKVFQRIGRMDDFVVVKGLFLWRFKEINIIFWRVIEVGKYVGSSWLEVGNKFLHVKGVIDGREEKGEVCGLPKEKRRWRGFVC